MSLPWFDRWAMRHYLIHSSQGVPSPAENPDQWGALEAEFERLGITEQAAKSATQRLISRPPSPRKHFAILFETALALLPKKADAVPDNRPEKERPIDIGEACKILEFTDESQPPAIRAMAARVLQGRISRGTCPIDVQPAIPELPDADNLRQSQPRNLRAPRGTHRGVSARPLQVGIPAPVGDPDGRG